MAKRRTKKKNHLKTIYWVLGSISLLLGIVWTSMNIFGVESLSELTPESTSKNVEIEIIPSLTFISEGQYPEGIEILFTIPDIKNKNITSVKIDAEMVVVDRKNKHEQLQVSKINWGTSYRSSSLVLYNSKSTSSTKELTFEGKFWGCNNCFMSEDSPYIITFPIQYTVGNSPIITKTKEIIIPIE